jgi:arsenical pump membrane protein
VPGREGIEVGTWHFLRLGVLVMPPALMLSIGALAFLTAHL